LSICYTCLSCHLTWRTFDQRALHASIPEHTWSSLVHRIAAADQTALAEFYDATSHLVYGLVARILGNSADAEEVTLDTYIQVWRAASTFDGCRGSAVAWLTTIARSRAIDRLRAGGQRVRREEPLEDSTAATVVRAPVHPGLAREVETALRLLSPEQGKPSNWPIGTATATRSWRTGSVSQSAPSRPTSERGMMKLRSQLGASA